MSNAGKFIVVEGIDGAGKTTTCHFIKNVLSAQRECFLTEEPRKMGMGADIRRLVHSGQPIPPPMVMACMFVIDRYYHTQRIQERLAAGCTVICDRYLWSTYAYQIAARDLNRAFALKEMHSDFYLPPDLVLYLDLQPAVAMERLHGRSADRSSYEYLEKQLTCYEGYKAHMLQHKVGFGTQTQLVVVDANTDEASVNQRILAALHDCGYLANIRDVEVIR